MKILKFKIHSIVNIITNSSTVIYTYQNSIDEAKSLVEAILNLMGEIDLKPEDVFYYETFCENYIYLERMESLDKIERAPKIPDWGDDNYKEDEKKMNKWFISLKNSILMGEIEKPDWMYSIESEDYDCQPEIYLNLLPKKKKYEKLAEAMSTFLNSPSHKVTYG